MAKAESCISIDKLNKSYKDNHVLQDVSFEVKKGEVFGLIGLNGAGKTTMIKILLGLLKKDSGDATIFGHDIFKTSTRDHLAFLPEKFQPSTHLKGYEQISLSLSFYKQKMDKKKAVKWAESLELNPDMLSHKITKYSKGMGQKLGLLSTILAERPLLILDEPMSGLDPKARILFKNAVLDYAKRGNTVFFSSHILSDIDEICDRIAILHNHKIIYTGTPAGFKKETKQESLEKAFLSVIS